MMSNLDSVESFIKINHHLRDIPSVREIARHGLDLGDMQQKHLDKIEGLARYLIDMDKQMQALTKHVDEQSAVHLELRRKTSPLQTKQADQ